LATYSNIGCTPVSALWRRFPIDQRVFLPTQPFAHRTIASRLFLVWLHLLPFLPAARPLPSDDKATLNRKNVLRMIRGRGPDKRTTSWDPTRVVGFLCSYSPKCLEGNRAVEKALSDRSVVPKTGPNTTKTSPIYLSKRGSRPLNRAQKRVLGFFNTLVSSRHFGEKASRYSHPRWRPL
jgi:hypothetical protein